MTGLNRARPWLLTSAFLTLGLGTLPGCATDTLADNDTSGESAQVGAAAPQLCAAVKGNGPRILAQIASLARVTEEFGELNAISGGSSASISMFLYESILLNPVIADNKCGAAACTPQQRAARISLLLKSIYGYGEVVAQEIGVKEITAEIAAFKQPVPAGETDAERATRTSALALKIYGVLRKGTVPAIVNTGELIPMLREKDPKKLAANVTEIQTAFDQFGKFQVPDNRVLFRVPIISWGGASSVFGKAADFYAGDKYGPFNKRGMQTFIDTCAEASRGKTWKETAGLTTPSGTCEAQFQKLLTDHRSAAAAGRPVGGQRLNDSVGQTLHAMVHSTAITGGTAAAYKAALATYTPGGTGDVAAFAPVKFGELQYGYWSNEGDKAAIGSASKGADAKSKKLTAFGKQTWAYILARSPAEPGISRAVDMSIVGDGKAYTTGGWGDALPTQVLRGLGCQNVVLITRQDHSSADFQRNLSRELGASDADVDAFYNQAATSVPAVSMKAADAVWCTDWDKPELKDQAGLEKEGFTAPLLLNKKGFVDKSFAAYKTVDATTAALPGCTAGIAPKP